MPDNPEQLILELDLAPRLTEEDFLVGSSNQIGWDLITGWPEWSDSIAILVGPEGSGKTHLASIWQSRTDALNLNPGEIKPDMVYEFRHQKALIIEDIDKTAFDENMLFHLLNLVRISRISVLITARSKPQSWHIKTKDLLSRLRMAPVFELKPPDDPLLRAVIVKLFLDRQLVIDTEIVEYLARRIERSFAKAKEIVALLDKEAMKSGRRITRPMVSQIMKTMM